MLLEVCSPVVMFAKVLTVDISLGSDSGNLVIPNSRWEKERPRNTCVTANQHGRQTRSHLLNLRRAWPGLAHQSARAISAGRTCSPGAAKLCWIEEVCSDLELWLPPSFRSSSPAKCWGAGGIISSPRPGSEIRVTSPPLCLKMVYLIEQNNKHT